MFGGTSPALDVYPQGIGANRRLVAYDTGTLAKELRRRPGRKKVPMFLGEGKNWVKLGCEDLALLAGGFKHFF